MFVIVKLTVYHEPDLQKSTLHIHFVQFSQLCGPVATIVYLFFSDEETNVWWLINLPIVPQLVNENQNLDQGNLTSPWLYY